jgi:ribosome-associated protein
MNIPAALTTLDDMVNTILGSLDDDKAQDILTIDLVGKTSIADRMIIASGTSARMVSAMSEHLVLKLKAMGLKPKSEGERNGDWVLIDAGDVVVHLFRPEVRQFYNIERIWAAPAAENTPTPTPRKTTKRA